MRWDRSAGQWQETLLLPCGLTAAMGVNDSGTAVGWWWQINTPGCPVIWEEDEGECAPIPGAWFTDINSSGQIVGGPLFSGEVPALIWEDGEVKDASASAQVLSIDNEYFACGEYGGMPVTRHDGARAQCRRSAAECRPRRRQ